MDQETEAPLDDLEAVDGVEDESDLGDGGYTYTCGACGGKTK